MERHNAQSFIEESDTDARERGAFNAAFRELGLRWHWDAATFDQLKTIADDGERVRTYLESREPHLLKAYDAGFLVSAVCALKHQAAATRSGARHRAGRVADCADFATAQTGF